MMFWRARIRLQIVVARWVEADNEDIVISAVLKHLNNVRQSINPTEPELVWDNNVRAILSI